ncbi:four-carbon acid sugar kinase family protein [Corynebacterium sp.]|uniref:four-carbon acid sugar kinase family protein n=1 Tax=Corynebacterium sp. TaxID=1720 RepID=UPI0026DD691F|nr:four-carbon acid sugar kinase family protein [Corynebacterium sp.]MDO5031867.1 four-carbon acid sugar kinase family protein [Corynebacterium sp.]
MPFSLAELTKNCRPPVAIDAAEVPKRNDILIVLDDDPTGTQSVRDLPVLTRWTQEDMEWAFSQGAPAIYVMTNSRSLSPEDARRINEDVARSALAASEGRKLSFVSRSDSTLRGHFPLEPDTLAEISHEHGEDVDGYLLVPAFPDAGRVTIDGVHYAGSKLDGFSPVAETEFAQDASFGYHSSKLNEWVEEKTEGRVPASDVLSISLDTLRAGKAADVLQAATDQSPIVVDVVTEEDLRLLAVALHVAESSGKKFIYRVGPPFVRAVIGQDIPAVVDEQSLENAGVTQDHLVGGLIVVGSHVPTTTRQLNALVASDLATIFELDVHKVLDDESGYVDALAKKIVQTLEHGNAVLHTSRTLVTGKNEDDSLRIARTVSAALVSAVNKVVTTSTPKFVIAKGGITSSDTASRGLEMTRATVVGPMQPGIISLWKSEDGPAEGIPYIVFAGNVGNDQSLVDVVSRLSN